ncbi:unnamed protein product [Urochloa humidicola]
MAVGFGEMVDHILAAQQAGHGQGDAQGDAHDDQGGGGGGGGGGGADGGGGAGAAPDGAGDQGHAGDNVHDGGGSTSGHNQDGAGDNNQGPKSASGNQENAPDDVPSHSTDCSNIQNVGIASAVHIEELPEDEPNSQSGFSALELLNSQSVNPAHHGPEFECNTSQYTQEEPTQYDDLMENTDNVDKYTNDVLQKQAVAQPDVNEICSPPSHVGPNVVDRNANVQNSPTQLSCSTNPSSSRYLNITNSQGRPPTPPISTSLFEGDSAANEAMERACDTVYKEAYIEEMEIGDNIGGHGGESSAPEKTGERPSYTQGPIFDLTPAVCRPSLESEEHGQNEVAIEITPRTNDRDNSPRPVIYAATPSNPPSQNILTTKPPCFSFDIAKCRELRSAFLEPECSFASEVVMRFGGWFASRHDIVGSFANNKEAEEMFMDMFITTMNKDDKFRDGRIAILDMSSVNLLNWENQYKVDDPAAQDFDKKHVIEQMKEKLPLDMKKYKILFVLVLDRGHWFLMVVNGPADVVKIIDCFPYEK